MITKKIDLQQRLKAIESSLEILRQNLIQLSDQPDELSATIKQLSQIKSELQQVLETFYQPSNQLISVLNHEFLTPLTLIQGPLQLLASGKSSSFSQETQYLLKVAFKQIDKLTAILRELLAYQQMKSGQLSISPQYCSVAELAQQSAQFIQLNIRNVAVILSVKPKFVAVWADPHYIVLLISHLLSNAIKFSPNRSIVTLNAKLKKSGEDQLVLFQITDRGIGITSDELNKIFDCFYQVDRSDSRSYNGLGLGLALSHQIIQLHGGKLWAESRLGRGSSFYFTLPVFPIVENWWVEIQTTNPPCIYYFGPFETSVEAGELQEGYLEDLRQEQAQIITVEIKQCRPEDLTICLSDEN